MTKFKLHNLLDTGTKDKKKPRYESKKMVLNQAQKIRLKNSSYISSGYKLNFGQLSGMHHTQN